MYNKHNKNWISTENSITVSWQILASAKFKVKV